MFNYLFCGEFVGMSLKIDLFCPVHLGVKKWIFPRSYTDARCEFRVVDFLQWNQSFSSARKGHETRLGSGWDKDKDPFVLVMQSGSGFLSVKSSYGSNVLHHNILDVLFGWTDFLKKKEHF